MSTVYSVDLATRGPAVDSKSRQGTTIVFFQKTEETRKHEEH